MASAKRVLSLQAMTFEEHMLFSTLKHHASNKAGVSLSQLQCMISQKPKISSQVSYFTPSYKTERELAAALQVFVLAGWATTAIKDRTTKYFMSDKETAKAFATGSASSSKTNAEVDAMVVEGLKALGEKSGNMEIYHEFCSLCWVVSLPSGAISASLRRLINAPVLGNNAESTYICVSKMSLPRNSTEYWGIRACAAPTATAASASVAENLGDDLDA